ncbi:MAG TPA: protein-disulfide reductase DsbD domain-containing protein, partial [Luteolibacter sp.]|nr:protein-disulfide reductase DsbD domain-containing protein [Luteolibacter sp.]
SQLLRPLLWLVIPFSASPWAAGQFSFNAAGAAASEARVVAEVKSIAPGEPFSVALELSHPDDWHSYYLNSGGVELPLAIEWTLPDGFTAGGIQWPAPSVKEGFTGKSFIYEGSPIFLVEITPSDALVPGESVTITANAEWQICKDACINEEKSLTLTLPVAETAEPDPAAADLFARARASMPAAADGWEFHATGRDAEIVFRIEGGAQDSEFTDFVPDQPFVKSAGDGGSIDREGDAWVVRLQRATVDAFDNEIEQGDSLSGILLGDRPLKVPATTIAAPPPEPAPLSKFLPILGGMLIGGLILNLMPCVFPVIGLKIMGFVQQAGSDRKKIALHGLTFTAGVLASFGVLSGILFAARAAAGNSIGWGYQLQEPWVVFALMLLMFVLALNLFGVFEIGATATSVGGSLQSKHGFAGSFFSGVLATVVATPCSAPFLGAAIGAAIALPATQFFGAFAAMALGLSLPYLVLSVFPKFIDFLPRPGAWMESFKQGMSFLLFATAGYLLWIYAGLIDLENLLDPLLGLSCIAIAAWIYGRWCLPHRRKNVRIAALAVTAAFAAAGFLLAKPPKPSALEWQTWSAETQQQLLDDGTPVYIDFTAKWCATCQVNKKRAYTAQVIDLMKQKGVVALKADKTKPDPEIEKALREYGRSAIPVNVLLVPGRVPVILPELLSPDDVIEALESL